MKRPIRQFRLIWLEAFLAVADKKSFTGAAKSLGYNQSSVTRHVEALEFWLGKMLFFDSVPPELTVEGEEFVPIAWEVMEKLTGSRKEPERPRPKISAKDIDMSWYTPKGGDG